MKAFDPQSVLAPHWADIRASIVRVRRERLRVAVRHIVMDPARYLVAQGLPADATPEVVMVHLRRSRRNMGHWAFTPCRHRELRHLYVALRYERLVLQRWHREVAS